jgi:hypothetical protein
VLLLLPVILQHDMHLLESTLRTLPHHTPLLTPLLLLKAQLARHLHTP